MARGQSTGDGRGRGRGGSAPSTRGNRGGAQRRSSRVTSATVDGAAATAVVPGNAAATITNTPASEHNIHPVPAMPVSIPPAASTGTSTSAQRPTPTATPPSPFLPVARPFAAPAIDPALVDQGNAARFQAGPVAATVPQTSMPTELAAIMAQMREIQGECRCMRL